MAPSRVGSPAASCRDEAEPGRTIVAGRDDVLRNRFADQRRHRLTLAPRQRLKLPLEALVDEDGRPFHMTYVIIP